MRGARLHVCRPTCRETCSKNHGNFVIPCDPSKMWSCLNVFAIAVTKSSDQLGLVSRTGSSQTVHSDHEIPLHSTDIPHRSTIDRDCAEGSTVLRLAGR
jgi:hypothetical protein